MYSLAHHPVSRHGAHGLVFVFTLFAVSIAQRPIHADPLTLEWVTQYCNETIQTADLSTNPRMLRNIMNSLMTSAPVFLDGALYLQRRTEFVNRCPDLEGIGEPSAEWLRPDRVSISGNAIVLAAVREDLFPGSSDVLTGLGWIPYGGSITLGYVDGPLEIPLYAGLIPAGSVHLAGSEINSLRNGGDSREASMYFYFLPTDAVPPQHLAQFNSVAVPEPDGLILGAAALCALIAARRRHA